jgi:hypothetical protein
MVVSNNPGHPQTGVLACHSGHAAMHTWPCNLGTLNIKALMYMGLFYGFSRIYMGLHGSSWTQLRPETLNVESRIYMGLHGFSRIYSGLHGSSWTQHKP